ncbi:MAG: 30S ribosomal protein S17 [Pseudomonadota bacterium]
MPKRILQGRVVSAKNDKTITVLVERAFQHPVLKKTVRKTKKYRAHDEVNAATEGEMVRIIECAPKSKMKRWELVTATIDAELEASRLERKADTDAAEAAAHEAAAEAAPAE